MAVLPFQEADVIQAGARSRRDREGRREYQLAVVVFFPDTGEKNVHEIRVSQSPESNGERQDRYGRATKVPELHEKSRKNSGILWRNPRKFDSVEQVSFELREGMP
jgi:hypothetical protein